MSPDCCVDSSIPRILRSSAQWAVETGGSKARRLLMGNPVNSRFIDRIPTEELRPAGVTEFLLLMPLARRYRSPQLRSKMIEIPLGLDHLASGARIATTVRTSPDKEHRSVSPLAHVKRLRCINAVTTREMDGMINSK